MALKLMYITNNPLLASVAEENGVDWIFVDLELMGKENRQGHLDTVISRHNMNDVGKIKKVLKRSSLLVRCNPMYENSENEINEIIRLGADIVMLPYFQTVNEVREFINIIGSRVKTCLLLETPRAVENIDKILCLKGIDYIHIGLNDLHLGYGMNFMFELFCNGILETIVKKIKEKDIQFGIGGVAKIGNGLLPAEFILAEQYRLGSSMTILSRSFFSEEIFDEKNIKIFEKSVREFRQFEKDIVKYKVSDFISNKTVMCEIVDSIVRKKND